MDARAEGERPQARKGLFAKAWIELGEGEDGAIDACCLGAQFHEMWEKRHFFDYSRRYVVSRKKDSSKAPQALDDLKQVISGSGLELVASYFQVLEH